MTLPDLNDKILFITGASRGIGKAIALRVARDGADAIKASKRRHCAPTLNPWHPASSTFACTTARGISPGCR